MTQAHTHEPWKVSRSWIVDENGYRIVLAPYSASDPVSAANLRRIAACANACAGITTEHLELIVREGRGFGVGRSFDAEGSP